ncbi:RDD family protein [Gilvimarinus agarilyticus]|uniref:RDD family protein n=1 Tax=unclassified Gilvimarinus TaxID=2642066 RepID=UPI001C0961BC|nr:MULTISPECIES: RDD family protein [unclassified Gilvimarinus]MBU2885584.1 RDD family protein [Gilvimarinus agarilyticus]MDO6570451.1 RDD family protein [Gilvimarinus sp. 2_MG-2023]MDO6746503.1 RDD family protein [Gilvimarinus sp. 1_MG-2023]
MTDPTPAAATPTYTGFGLRLLASIIDSLVITPLLIALAIGLYQHSGSWLNMLMASAENPWLNYGVPAAFTLLFWLVKSATPGKMLLGAVIVDAASLQPPQRWQLAVRYLGYYVSLIPLGLGFIWIAFDSKKQGWHDKLARTLVIQAASQTPSREN